MDPSSFHPPSLPDHDATVARDWVLLDARAYMSDRRNGTTATAFASNGLILEVSFWFAAPPALSHFTVHCRGLDEKNGLAAEPRLVCSDEYVAVLSVDYAGDEGVRRNFFVYTAIPDRPSLVRLPSPGPFTSDPREVGLLRTADGEGFAVAVLSPQLLTPGWGAPHAAKRSIINLCVYGVPPSPVYKGVEEGEGRPSTMALPEESYSRRE
uniref:DUF1618 domain-containing protein n=1 Tax=Aegilops tauschii TaxID=37682 RepID=M8BAU1_AEGTA